MIKCVEVLTQTLSFYLTITLLSVTLLRIRSLNNIMVAMVISSFAKLFAIPSAMWSQNTNLLILSYVLVLVNNSVALRVLSGRIVPSACVVLCAFLVERYTANHFGNNFPWDSVEVFQRTVRHSIEFVRAEMYPQQQSIEL